MYTCCRFSGGEICYDRDEDSDDALSSARCHELKRIIHTKLTSEYNRIL